MSAKIPFSTEELKRLLNVYEQEEKALKKKLKVTQATLKKLKEGLNLEVQQESNILLTEDEDTVDVVTIKKDNVPKGKVIIPKVPPSKRGRKPKKKKASKTIPSDFDIAQLNWKNFIITSIRNQNEIMSVEMLVDIAVRAYNLKAFPKDDISLNIKNTLEELDKQEIVVSKILENNEVFYGYSPWFLRNGDLKPEYLSTYKFSDSTEEDDLEESEDDNEDTELSNKWQTSIMHSLNKTKKLHTVKEFVSHALKHMDLGKEEIDKLESYIEENVEYMLHAEILKRMPVSNGGYQYALPHWFKKGDGKLKVYYMAHP
ncbi:MAG: hypothetical protein KAI79_06760 [Bacteroidales bacterium]|nr:hypothetical protein [Bacteroidales bacterium]